MRGYIVALFLALLPGMASAEIKVSPSYVERQLDMTRAPLMCTTTDLALDSLLEQRKLHGCEFYTILTPCVRGYEQIGRVWFSVMAIGPPGNQRFWYVRGKIRTKKFCRV